MADGIFTGAVFGVLATLFSYFIAVFISRKTGNAVFNPILIAIVLIIVFMIIFKIEYSFYRIGGNLINYLLGPAVVALAVPLYKNIAEIGKNKKGIIVSLICGSITGILSAVMIAYLLGGDREVLLSIAPKSVTTPIAIGIAEKTGGIPSLTAVIVIITGITGAVFGGKFLDIIKVRDPVARGFSIGMASHVIGTSKIMEEGETQGALSGLAIGLNGILTAVLTPIIMRFLFGY